MATLRETGPYIYPTIAARNFWPASTAESGKSGSRSTTTARAWEKLESDFNLNRYNIEHTELVRLCTGEYEQRGFTVTVESARTNSNG